MSKIDDDPHPALRNIDLFTKWMTHFFYFSIFISLEIISEADRIFKIITVGAEYKILSTEKRALIGFCVHHQKSC
jgi:hypothetical protein